MSPDTIQGPATEAAAPSPSQPMGYSPEPGTESSALREFRETTGEQVRQIASDIKESTGEALRSAKSAGMGLAHQQKEKLVAKIDQYTEAVQAASESWKDSEDNPLAVPAEKVKVQLRRAADYLRSREPGACVNDLSDFARRRPEVVFGGLFMIGLASVRFLKASSREQNKGRRGGNYASRPRGASWQAPSAYPASDISPAVPAPAYQPHYPPVTP